MTRCQANIVHRITNTHKQNICICLFFYGKIMFISITHKQTNSTDIKYQYILRVKDALAAI